MFIGTDPDNAAIPYLTAVSSFKSVWFMDLSHDQSHILLTIPPVQFGDLLGTAFLLLAFLALTAVGDPFVISLGGQDPSAVLAP